MNELSRANRWAALLAVSAVVILVGVVAYNLGVSHGLAESGQVYPYGWYRPWGFGFGLFPFLFFAFWFLAVRTLFWRSSWRRHWHEDGPRDIPRMFDEWHRRAHERMNAGPPASDA